MDERKFKVTAFFFGRVVEMEGSWGLNKVINATNDAKANGYYQLQYNGGFFIVPFDLLYWDVKYE